MGDIADIYGQGFDTGSVEPSTGFGPIPAGWYPVEVEAAEVKDTKAGTGKYLWLELSIIGDQYNGRKLFANINLMNPNEKAVEIGMRELAALGLACGLAAITDSHELIGKTIECRVKVEAAKGDFDADNKVTAYRPLGGQQPAAAPAAPARNAAPQPQQPRPQAPAPGKRPWER